MEGIVPEVAQSAKDRLEKGLRRCRDGRQRIRYLIILNLVAGRGPTETARVLGVGRSTVYEVARRFREQGEAGLVDHREENGERKLDEWYLAVLYEVVRSSPQDYGWRRPTWTREMLVETLFQKTGVRIHVATMSRALKRIGARRGRPKPIVNCPWSKRAKNRRFRELQRLVADLPPDEVVLYEDEIDIHLNPKIGLDWMVRSQQKEVLTPGQNEKRYLAGAQDARTGEITWVEGDQKNSFLFILVLWEIVQRYADARKIHVILDNYAIHTTEQVRVSLQSDEGQRLQLHFLPPYCPDHNKIERTWQDLHANVTRNHTRPTMNHLMQDVRAYLRRRNRRHQPTAAA